MTMRLPRLELKRVDLATDTSGLPPSLIDAIEADGGLWQAGDAYTSADEVIATARRVGAHALRLDFRDLTLLEQLPDVRYLHLRSDGRPVLDPVAALTGLRALIVGTGGQRGDLDPFTLPRLRWLKIGLGGKGGAAMVAHLSRGHDGLEWLSITETRARTAAELVTGFPRLRMLRLHFADDLRDLGALATATPELEKLSLSITGIRSVAGLELLPRLHTLSIVGGRVSDVAPIAGSRALRYLQLEMPRLESIEPLRAHPSLRMALIRLEPTADVSVLDSIPGLIRVARLDKEDPLRGEWLRAMRE
jgi:hypothetical protein